MTTEAIHTEIVDIKTIDGIEIIRENPKGYPEGKSNIYAKNSNGEVLWYAELPLTGDIYVNPIQWGKGINKGRTTWEDYLITSNDSFVVSSWNCYTVSIDTKNGKIIHSDFTK